MGARRAATRTSSTRSRCGRSRPGLIGGRIYFLITTPSQVPHHWWGPFAIWKGGLGIWGGVAAGVAVGLWCPAPARRADLRRFMDAAAPGLLVAQAIGRIGNYFNQELFGEPTTLPWALEISPAHRPPGYAPVRDLPADVPLRDHLEPVAGRVPGLARRAPSQIRAPGLFALYVAGYSASGSSRRRCGSTTPNHILGLRLNFFVALVLCLLGLPGSSRSSAAGAAGAAPRLRSSRPKSAGISTPPSAVPAGPLPPRVRAARRPIRAPRRGNSPRRPRAKPAAAGADPVRALCLSS